MEKEFGGKEGLQGGEERGYLRGGLFLLVLAGEEPF